MEYLFTALNSDIDVLAAAIEWWREVCAPALKESNGLWEEWPRAMGVDGSEINFSNPVYALRSLDQKKAVQIIQQDPPDSSSRPPLYMLIRSAFKGYDDVNNGRGTANMDIGCPASPLAKEKVQILLKAWINDDLDPQKLLALAKEIQPPYEGYLGVDL